MILYGIASEGFGHFYRSWPILEELQRTLDIRVVSDLDFISKNTNSEFCGIHINSIKFTRNNHKINLPASLMVAIKNVYLNYSILAKYKPKLCITDYEPSVAWFAYLNNIPLITVDNQHRFNYCELNLPIMSKLEAAKLAFFNKLYIPKPKFSIISTFCSRVKPKFDRAKIVNLGVQDVLKSSVQKNTIVIYGKEPTYSNVVKVVNKLKLNNIIVYSNGITGIEGAEYKRFDRKSFLKDLSEAKYCIGSAGNQLATECDCLDLPFLAIAEDNQIEQILNTKMLKYGILNNCEDIEKQLVKMLADDSIRTPKKKDNGVMEAVKIIKGELCRLSR